MGRSQKRKAWTSQAHRIAKQSKCAKRDTVPVIPSVKKLREMGKVVCRFSSREVGL